MFNLQKFNDDQYEGLSLNIPLWFYDINKEKLSPIFSELKNTLEKSLSYLHPDNQRNIFELANFENKRSMINDRIRIESEKIEAYKKYQSDLLSGNIFPIAQNKYTDVLDIDSGFIFVLNNKDEIEFLTSDMVTNSYSLNSKFTNKLKEIFLKVDWAETATKNRLALLSHHFYGTDGFRIKPEDITIGSFSANVWTLKLTFSVRCVKYYFKKRSGKIFYRECNLEWSDVENCYSFVFGLDRISLKNYKESQGRFILNT